MITFTLTRGNTIPNGILGTLSGDNGFSSVTLERTWNGLPKIPVGAYTCKRGTFQLDGYPAPQEYFQVMNVPNHTDILIHPANYVADLNGCIGVGDTDGNNMICDSRDAFNRFMASLVSQDECTLVVS